MKVKFILIGLLVYSKVNGQELVKDIRVGGQSSFPTELTKVNNNVFFTAHDGVNGFELWKSDGTNTGTNMVKDIYPGQFHANIGTIVELNGIAIFAADDNSNGKELWRSDGTELGTYMLKDVRSGASGSDITNLISINGKVYFNANDGVNGNELWKTDGTSAGTMLVKDINPGIGLANPSTFFNFNGSLLFVADDVNGQEVWISDGTSSGTIMLNDICNTTNRPFGLNSKPFFTQVGNEVFFAPTKNSTTGLSELWKTDGSASGTSLITQIKISTGTVANRFASVNGALFFAGSDTQNGDELWTSDGTAAGTVLFKDLNPGAAHSYARQLEVVNGVLYFEGDDGTNGFEIWKTNGTLSGTTILKNINPTGSSNPGQFIEHDNLMYFIASNGSGSIPWKTDGTESGTVQAWPNTNIRFVEFDSNDNPTMASVNNILFFRPSTGDSELWKYDAATASLNSLENNNLSIYPNPVSEKLTIHSESSVISNVQIKDASGKLVYTNMSTFSTVEIDMTAFETGVYFVECMVEGEILREKITVTN